LVYQKKHLPRKLGISEEVFTTRTGYIRTRIYHNSFVAEEESVYHNTCVSKEVFITIALLQKKCLRQQLFRRGSVYHKSCVAAEVFTTRAV